MGAIDFTALKNSRKAVEDMVEDNIPEELEKTYSNVWGSSSEKIIYIETNRIVPYIDCQGNGQPFKLNEKKVEQIIASAKDIGIITPLRVRPKSGGYEVISGHHRLEAAKRMSFLKVPCIVKEYSDKEVFQVLTESNIQRDRTLPSEYGRIFTRYMEIRSDADLTAEEIAAKFDVSKKTMYRYLNVYKLIPELQELTDNEVINIGAVDYICILPESVQKTLYMVLANNGKKVSVAVGKRFKSLYNASENGVLSQQEIEALFVKTEHRNRTSIEISPKLVEKYFSDNSTNEDVEKIIDMALTEYFNKI